LKLFPKDFIDDVARTHENSLIWSGALWEITSRLGSDRSAFDKALRLVLRSNDVLAQELRATHIKRISFNRAAIALLKADCELFSGADLNSIVGGFASRGIQIPNQCPHELQIFANHANEPYLAVDPKDNRHAVVAFNDLTPLGGVKCGWAESRDGGLSWISGSVKMPFGFRALGDPWVRYGPDGKLFYSCIGATPFESPGFNPFFRKRTVGIFMAVSDTGLAQNLQIATAVTMVQQNCPGMITTPLLGCQGEEEGVFTDHPSLGIFKKADGASRLVACWVDFFDPSGNTFVKVAYSDEGKIWSEPQTLAGPNVRACTVGGGDSQIAVSWWNKRTNTLELRTSRDGITWSRPTALAQVGDLVGGVSTTSRVLSVPYALIVANGDGLRAVYQVRDGDHSQVFIADSDNDWHRIPIGDANSETFLPGAGTCPNLVGMYEARRASEGFRYTVWFINSTGLGQQLILEFASGAELQGQDGDADPRFSLPRIGDYTGVDCSGNFGWASWTDTRSGQPRVWGAVFPIEE